MAKKQSLDFKAISPKATAAPHKAMFKEISPLGQPRTMKASDGFEGL